MPAVSLWQPMRLNMLKKGRFTIMPQGGSDFLSSLGSFFSGSGMLIIMMIVLLLVMIIPQRKRDKKIKDMLASIKVGDRVRTIGGIYGTVTNIKDDIITISVGPDKARLVFARGAIANVEDVAVENTMEESNSK
jgi:preprotein translocase subunit YajC